MSGQSGELNAVERRLVAEAEGDLSRLLSVEPSPEFAARVRARISEPDMARGWRAGWLGLAVASVAALVVAVAMRSAPGVRDSAVPSPNPSHDDIVLNVAPPAIPGAMSIPTVATPRAVPQPARIEAPRPGEPEVLIDASLAVAIRRLAISTRNVPFVETAEASSLEPALDVSVPSVVVVEPLTVPELVLKPADGNGGR